jgi:hypothetical protein
LIFNTRPFVSSKILKLSHLNSSNPKLGPRFDDNCDKFPEINRALESTLFRHNVKTNKFQNE